MAPYCPQSKVLAFPIHHDLALICPSCFTSRHPPCNTHPRFPPIIEAACFYWACTAYTLWDWRFCSIWAPCLKWTSVSFYSAVVPPILHGVDHIPVVLRTLLRFFCLEFFSPCGVLLVPLSEPLLPSAECLVGFSVGLFSLSECGIPEGRH